MNVTTHLLDGQASDKKAYKSKVDGLQTHRDLKCSTCKKKCAPHYYRVIETGICYPITSLASEPAKPESIIVLCSLRCQQKWDKTLMCLKCKTFEFRRAGRRRHHIQIPCSCWTIWHNITIVVKILRDFLSVPSHERKRAWFLCRCAPHVAASCFPAHPMLHICISPGVMTRDGNADNQRDDASMPQCSSD